MVGGGGVLTKTCLRSPCVLLLSKRIDAWIVLMEVVFSARALLMFRAAAVALVPR